jgi:hypothetical protein
MIYFTPGTPDDSTKLRCHALSLGSLAITSPAGNDLGHFCIYKYFLSNKKKSLFLQSFILGTRNFGVRAMIHIGEYDDYQHVVY